ncbi:MAG TPA: LytTR family DNA-binding domain-containing protein [Chitinophagaceae bacterium]|nr:LytTR family DNA-binding domain-containing protein [Chitinophagaceae bacterium]
MLRAVLIDDDQSNLSALSEKLAKHCPQVKVICRCDNAAEGIAVIEREKPSLVFLDIEMPVMNGFVLLQQLEYRSFGLIFVTAYDHYAIKAIKYSALDYLVKPVEIDDLKAAIAKAEANSENRNAQLQLELLLEHLNKKQPKRITIPTSDGLHFINLDNIIYLEASNNYTQIYLATNQKYLVSRTLKEFEEMLPSDPFVRIHHSTIVNKQYVEKYIRGDGGQVVMRHGRVLDVSKRRKTEFLQAIGY